MHKKIKAPKVKEIFHTKDGETYKYFMVVWYDRSGKRQRKQFNNRQEAALFASETHTAMLNDGASRRILSTILAEPVLRKCESAIERLGNKYGLDEVVEFFLKHHREASFKISMEEASVQFLGSQEGRMREASLHEFRRTLRAFTTQTGNPNVDEITHDTVERYMQSLRAKDGVNAAAPKTLNNNRKSLMRFFNWCIEKPQKFIEINPLADIKALTIEKGDVETMSSQKVADLMRYVEGFKGGSLVRYFALAIFAGVRPHGEMGRLNKKDSAIDLDNGVIKIAGSVAKMGDSRQIEIQPNLRQWLTKYQGPIFPKGSSRDITAIRAQFELCEAKHHDVMRHTFISNHVQAFDSFAQTAIQAGNSETIIRKHYFNVTSKAEALKFWQIAPAA
jgi:site-specific recombinase XerD